jgi:hypothetical protein
MLLPCLIVALWRRSGNDKICRTSSAWLHLLLPARLARLHLLRPTCQLMQLSAVLLSSSLAAALAVAHSLLLLPAAAALVLHSSCERLAGGSAELHGYSCYGDYLSKTVLAALCQVSIRHGHAPEWHAAACFTACTASCAPMPSPQCRDA